MFSVRFIWVVNTFFPRWWFLKYVSNKSYLYDVLFPAYSCNDWQISLNKHIFKIILGTLCERTKCCAQFADILQQRRVQTNKNALWSLKPESLSHYLIGIGARHQITTGWLPRRKSCLLGVRQRSCCYKIRRGQYRCRAIRLHICSLNACCCQFSPYGHWLNNSIKDTYQLFRHWP